jgi:hypothetical protein
MSHLRGTGTLPRGTWTRDYAIATRGGLLPPPLSRIAPSFVRLIAFGIDYDFDIIRLTNLSLILTFRLLNTLN